MPCSDNRCETYREVEVDRQSTLDHVAFLEAALCASLTVMEQQMDEYGYSEGMSIFNAFDFKEAGITYKELEGWWITHKRADIERREREARQKQQKENRRKKQAIKTALLQSAKAKLTDEELEALGLQ
jgi:predicted DNA binding protein